VLGPDWHWLHDRGQRRTARTRQRVGTRLSLPALAVVSAALCFAVGLLKLGFSLTSYPANPYGYLNGIMAGDSCWNNCQTAWIPGTR